MIRSLSFALTTIFAPSASASPTQGASTTTCEPAPSGVGRMVLLGSELAHVVCDGKLAAREDVDNGLAKDMTDLWTHRVYVTDKYIIIGDNGDKYFSCGGSTTVEPKESPQGLGHLHYINIKVHDYEEYHFFTAAAGQQQQWIHAIAACADGATQEGTKRSIRSHGYIRQGHGEEAGLLNH